MIFNYGYGKTKKTFEIPDKNIIAELKQNSVEITLKGEDEVKRALENPIASTRLKDIVKKDEKTVIVTSDITRPLPSKVILPHVIDELLSAGLSCSDITIVFALGNHRKHTEDEKKALVGEEVFNKVKCLDSDHSECVFLGKTSRGTPVEIFRPVAEADRRICLGNIEYHYFAGYSGGMKAVMPGVSTHNAIQSNHSFMTRVEARAGEMRNNPVREDIEEVAGLVPVDFILNVVLDEKKEIIKAFAGHYLKAHREGCGFLDTLYKVSIPEKADIVIAAPGGFPKDINLYQAQKALDNSKNAVKDGGIVILLAACSEGLGEEVFERWMLNAESSEQLIKDIERNFELGGHKAAAIAMVLRRAEIFLVSDMKREFVKKLFMEPFEDINDAIHEAFKRKGSDSKVILMPHGGSALPVYSKINDNILLITS